jgi:3-oxoacyl-[acyl-carrier protein] reductase
MLLEGKNVILTGCARGIGRRMLVVFAENGAHVWACARNPTAEFQQFTRELAELNGVMIRPLFFDLLDKAAMKDAVRAIVADKSPVDVLVNNAGITHNTLYQMTPVEKMREMFEVNFFSQVALTQSVIRLMVRQKSGIVINVSSTAAIDANPGRSAYSASKAAVIGMTRVMAHELAAHNIRVNAIAPGITETDMLQGSMSQAAIDAAVGQTRLKRLGSPSDIAGAALFLASDLSSYVTGEVLRVDGGLQNG